MRGLPRLASSVTTESRPAARSLSAASPKAPTPGRMILSEARRLSASPVTRASYPRAARELLSEKRLPTP